MSFDLYDLAEDQFIPFDVVFQMIDDIFGDISATDHYANK
jgi:hypothetical protein